MLISSRWDKLRTFSVRADGRVEEGDPIRLHNTLFAHAFGPEDAALLRVDVPKQDGFDGMAERLRLTGALRGGIRSFQVLGAGHGVKDGKLYAAAADVLSKVERLFGSAEDALAYGGLLFSESSHVLRLSSAKVTSKGDGDGQGWIDADVLREHGLPVRQIQVRALWSNALAKGTLLPIEGLRSRDGVDVLFHETQVKSPGKDVGGEFLLAIRDTACIRSYKSSWTWTQFLPEDAQDRLFDRYGRASLAAADRAMASIDSALAFLDAIQVEGHEEETRRDLLTSFLAAGLSPDHPWVHRRLLELVRRTYLDAALGLGPIPLTAGMAAVADDNRCKYEVTCNWIPEGCVTILRYPVRDGWSIRLVQNVHRAGFPEGSIGVSPRLMQELDGDFDGDWVAICTDRDVRRSVRTIHQAQAPRLPIPARTRKRSPLSSLARVAVENIGASGIGTPTYYVAAAVDDRRADLIPRLSLALQVATMGLKWSVDRDRTLVNDASSALEIPSWLELLRDKEVFATKAADVPEAGLGRVWNTCSKHFRANALGSKRSLGDFLDVVPTPAGDSDILAEVETWRQSFNRRIAASEGDQQTIESAIADVKEWAAGKAGAVRTQFARAAWYLSHRSASPRSTGSFAIHAFPDSLVADIAQTTGYRAPVVHRFAGAADEAAVETVEGRNCVRATVTPAIAVEAWTRESTVLRLVGGWKSLVEQFGVTESDALSYLDGVTRREDDGVDIVLAWTKAPWNGHMVLSAEAGDDLIGYVPEDVAERLGERLVGSHRARLLLRGRTMYATIS